jgi:hypothetical protein
LWPIPRPWSNWRRYPNDDEAQIHYALRSTRRLRRPTRPTPIN